MQTHISCSIMWYLIKLLGLFYLKWNKKYKILPYTPKIECRLFPLIRMGKSNCHIWVTVPTVKFLNFWTSENFPVIYLKFKQRGKTCGVFHQKDANGIANSEDPDQTARSSLIWIRTVCPDQSVGKLRLFAVFAHALEC